MSNTTDPSAAAQAAAAAASALQQLLELHDDARIVAYCAGQYCLWLAWKV
ncbi:hypothetical protein TRAPUB_9399 [Trametes pubescens]|uniref:Uncharacterized protein n=1 Tax=Trametes pubescens TaxID=154538 RepID=A0A1M2W2Q4_TRAPU|nr:hypothetical protein TRAPUB_9399 [Trametes pubescens]